MSTPTISIIIPAYNCEDYISESMDSLLAQTFQDFEIIVVDDGSTDQTYKILNRYAKKYKNIKVYQQENQFAGVARNHGMQFVSADSEYLIFLDADDIYLPNMLEKLYAEAQKYNCDVTVCRSDRMDSNTKEITECRWTIKEKLLPNHQPFTAKDVKQEFFNTFVWWSWDKLYKKSFIDNLNLKFQDLRTTNDLFFCCAAMLKAERISTIDDVLVHHRVNAGNTLSVTREKSWNNFLYALVELRSFMRKNKIWSYFEKDFVNYCAHLVLWNLNSLKGDAHSLLYQALHESWLEELQIITHSEGYFYDKLAYRKLKEVSQRSLEHFAMTRIYQLEKQLGTTDKAGIVAYISSKISNLEAKLMEGKK